MKTLGYKSTIISCFWGYICQAIIINFVPLLFITISRDYSIPMEQITLIIITNFLVQLTTDIAATRYASRIGYRRCLVSAHILCGAGLVLMTVLPEIISPLAGFCLSTVVYAVGGGLLEVLISPLVESCPTKNKAGVMSIMHSFYCWGVVLTVAVSAAFFAFFGTENWKVMAIIWSLVPFGNSVLLSLVPMDTLSESAELEHSAKDLFSHKLFYVMLALMLCAGAAELTVAQWVSAFAETGLGVDKTVGDLIGCCGFALAMAVSRALYGRFSDRIPLRTAILICSAVCIGGYLMIGLFENPIIALIGCIICGLSVGIFWPGTLSLATVKMPVVTTSMFAFLAIAGDMGCSIGPSLAGAVSAAAGGDLQLGIFSGIIFPIIILAAVIFLMPKDKPQERAEKISKTE